MSIFHIIKKKKYQIDDIFGVLSPSDREKLSELLMGGVEFEYFSYSDTNGKYSFEIDTVEFFVHIKTFDKQQIINNIISQLEFIRNDKRG